MQCHSTLCVTCNDGGVHQLEIYAAATAADSALSIQQLAERKAEFAATTEPGNFLSRYGSTIEFYDGYYIVDKDKTFKPRMFSRNMQFKPGEVYNRTDHNQTLNRLINLNLFKFVKNRFEPVPGIDSAKLNPRFSTLTSSVLLHFSLPSVPLLR